MGMKTNQAGFIAGPYHVDTVRIPDQDGERTTTVRKVIHATGMVALAYLQTTVGEDAGEAFIPWDLTPAQLDAQARLFQYSPDALDELEKAHLIIREMLNMLPTSKKIKLAEILDKKNLIGEGTTRAFERESVIKKIRGEV